MKLKLQRKVQIFIIGSSIAVFLIVLAYMSINANRMAREKAISITDRYVSEAAKGIKVKLETDLMLIRTLAESFRVYESLPIDVWKALIAKMYGEIFEKSSHIYTLWDSWELSVIDSTWEKPYGRYVNILWRENGVTKSSQELRSLDGDPEDIAILKTKLAPMIFEPYIDLYTSGGEALLITSIVYPMVLNGKYIGLVGVDITLELLQENIEGIKPYEGSYAYLISNGGLIAGHPNKELLSKNIVDIYPEDNEKFQILNKIGTGESFGFITSDENGNEIYVSYAPVFIGKCGTPWSVAMSVPMDVIMAKANNNSKVSLLIGILGILLMGIIISLISKRITSAILKGVEFAKKIAKGDLTATLDIRQSDEVGDLANALNEMVVNLREIVEGVILSAENISSASYEISSSSQIISQGASKQASSAEEVSLSMEQMVSNIQQSAENAKKTESVSENAANGISQVMNSANENKNLIIKIAEKISIINDIAFQTNILALNAAIEAAGAGEYGKGFAVVASQVRKLAERSKIAADEIEILSRTSVKANKEVAKLMEEISPEIKRTATLVHEISASNGLQEASAEQVNKAIVDLNKVTQQNATASKELATSSEELASQADRLKDNVSYFIVEKQYSKTNSIKKEVIQTEIENIKTDFMLNAKSEQGIELKMTDGDLNDGEFESF